MRNHASPIMRRNKVHHGRDVGFFIFDYGLVSRFRKDLKGLIVIFLACWQRVQMTGVKILFHQAVEWQSYNHLTQRDFTAFTFSNMLLILPHHGARNQSEPVEKVV